jgi:hypothetical protein
VAVDERIAQAEDLARGSAAYAKAFRISARICRNRSGETAAGQQLARIFEEKARLEDDLCRRLGADPIGTLREEGLA